MSVSTKSIGKPIDRVDGPLKVTGRATYAADSVVKDVTFAVLVFSTIPKGTIESIETTAAERSPGVLAVLTYQNAPKLKPQLPKQRAGVDPSAGEALPPLQDNLVRFNGQPIAVVIAHSFAEANRAAALVQARYRVEKATTEFSKALAHAVPPSKPKKKPGETDQPRGDAVTAFQAAPIRVMQTYTMAAENHNPMEPHATVAHWENGKLTLHDKTQWVDNVQEQVARAFGIKPDRVRVISPFVGGGFGAGLRVWPHVLIAAMAAQKVQRPVKLVLSRMQLFSSIGYRPAAVQNISLGSDREGRLKSIQHEVIGQTSTYEEFAENILDVTKKMYACPNVRTDYRLAAMNVNSPTPMRGPGEASGAYALESAMDELAVALKIDPVELRLRNHADNDPETGLPWSSKSLRECYRLGAQKFGWERRNPEPRSMREGSLLIGYGMASGTWPSNRQPASVRMRLLNDGSVRVQTASHDIGPGTYTSLSQIAADTLGLAVSRIKLELGDTDLPKAPVQGGSMTMASVGSAVFETAKQLREKILAALVRDQASPLHQATPENLEINDGQVTLRGEASRRDTFAEMGRRHSKSPVEVEHVSKPGDAAKKFTSHAFAAQFVEVRVDADLGIIRVPRVVSAIAAGRIINPKTARSQVIGGIVGGIGMALLEAVHWDPRNGRIVNANFADYHVPVNADVQELDAVFIEEQDTQVNPVGAKGIAELSIVGIAAAVANAIYHATGVRVRELPITLDKLLLATRSSGKS